MGAARKLSRMHEAPLTGESVRGRLSSAPAGWQPALFVWGVWVVMLLAALCLVETYGSSVPFFDEWHIVPFLIGEAVKPEWLWEQHNEHRIPLPKLLLLALYSASGGDFRAGMVFNVLALAGLAFFLIRSAAKLRGRASCADAFFPVALLQWGHAENFLWSWQVVFVLPTVIAGALLVVIVRAKSGLTWRSALQAGVCLLALPLCGANGLLLLLPLGLWLGITGAVRWRARGPGGKRAGAIALAAALGSLALAALYFIGYRKTREGLPTPRLRSVIGGALQFIAGGFGPATTRFWPHLAVGVALLAVLGAVLLLRSLPKVPSGERTRRLGLVSFLASFFCLGLGIGLGRPGANFVNLRYVTLAAPAVCGLFFMWMVAGSAALQRTVQGGLLGLLLLMVALGIPGDIAYARHRRAPLAAFERDLRDGTPPSLLLKRYEPALNPFSFDYEPARRSFPHTQIAHEELRGEMLGLRDHHIGMFRELRDDPPFDEIALDVAIASTNNMTWKNGRGRVTGPHPCLTFSLPASKWVAGLRIQFASGVTEGGTALGARLLWKGPGRNDFTGVAEYFAYPGDFGPIWVYETVDQIRIEPIWNAGVLQIDSLGLLVPAANPDPDAA